jgi:hypothetical protein
MADGEVRNGILLGVKPSTARISTPAIWSSVAAFRLLKRIAQERSRLKFGFSPGGCRPENHDPLNPRPTDSLDLPEITKGKGSSDEFGGNPLARCNLHKIDLGLWLGWYVFDMASHTRCQAVLKYVWSLHDGADCLGWGEELRLTALNGGHLNLKVIAPPCQDDAYIK